MLYFSTPWAKLKESIWWCQTMAWPSGMRNLALALASVSASEMSFIIGWIPRTMQVRTEFGVNAVRLSEFLCSLKNKMDEKRHNV